MNDMSVALEQNDQDIFACDVSDEALEIAGAAGKESAAHYTLGFCTGLSACPG